MFVCNRHALGTCWPGYIAELHRQLHLREREHAGLAVFLFLAERPRTISVDGLHYDRTPSCNRRASNRHRVRIARVIFRCKGPRAYRWLIPAIVLRVINPRVLARSAIATATRHGYPGTPPSSMEAFRHLGFEVRTFAGNLHVLLSFEARSRFNCDGSGQKGNGVLPRNVARVAVFIGGSYPLLRISCSPRHARVELFPCSGNICSYSWHIFLCSGRGTLRKTGSCLSQ